MIYEISKPRRGGKVRGLGDLVHRVAYPAAVAIDAIAKTDLKHCAKCAQRREKLNERFPL